MTQLLLYYFNTVSDFTSGTSFTWKTPFSILGDFLLLGIVSTLIGLICGFTCSYGLKAMRFLSVSAIKETLVMFCFGYIAYATGELTEMSGIIALLTSGVIMATYGW